MQALPAELVEAVMARLHVVDHVRLMTTSRRMYGLGRQHPRWLAFRTGRGLRAPIPGARKLKTDFDVVQRFLQSACSVCWARGAGANGVCRTCGARNRPFVGLTRAIRDCEHTIDSFQLNLSVLESLVLRMDDSLPQRESGLRNAALAARRERRRCRRVALAGE